MHEVVTIVAQYGIALPILGYLFIAVRKRQRLKELLILTLVSAILTYIFVKTAATLHSDPRPFIRDGVTPYFSSSTDNGFPSDHTVFSAVVAFIVLKYSKWLGIALAVVAVLIGAARVIGGVHHTQDIVAGVVIAAVSVFLANVLLKLLVKKPKDGKKR